MSIATYLNVYQISLVVLCRSYHVNNCLQIPPLLLMQYIMLPMLASDPNQLFHARHKLGSLCSSKFTQISDFCIYMFIIWFPLHAYICSLYYIINWSSHKDPVECILWISKAAIIPSIVFSIGARTSLIDFVTGELATSSSVLARPLQNVSWVKLIIGNAMNSVTQTCQTYMQRIAAFWYSFRGTTWPLLIESTTALGIIPICNMKVRTT